MASGSDSGLQMGLTGVRRRREIAVRDGRILHSRYSVATYASKLDHGTNLNLLLSTHCYIVGGEE